MISALTEKGTKNNGEDRLSQKGLFIALDDKPHKFLRAMLRALQRNHGLSIGLVIVRNGRIVEVIHKHA